MNGMIARHDGLAACQTNHGLVGQQDFLHQLFLVSIASTSIAQVVLGASPDPFLQVTLL